MKHNHTMLSIRHGVRGLMVLGMMAGMSFAQEYELRIESASTTIDGTGDSVSMTLDIVGDIFDPDGKEFMLFGGFAFQTSGSAVIESIDWIPASWSTENSEQGYLGDGRYGEIIYGQLPSAPDWSPNQESIMGSRIGSLRLNFASRNALMTDFHIGLIHGTDFTMSSVNVDSGATYYSTPKTLSLGSETGQVTPAPSSLGLLVIGGAWGARRRRAS